MNKKMFSLITAIMMTAGISAVSVGTAQFTGTVSVYAATADGLFENNLVKPRTPDEIRTYIEDHPAVYVDHDFITVDGKKYAQSVDGGGLSYYDDKYDEEPVVEKGKYDPGKVSDESLQHALNALNIERYIAGLDEVALSDEYNTACQTGSLVNAANNELTHQPTQPEGMDDAMYKTGYSATSSSNIAMGYPNLTSSVINAWMSDADDYNIDRLGHRRWCLNPSMKYTGFGRVDTTATYGSYSYTAPYTSMYSFDNSFGARDTKYMVSWPAANMPVELFGKNEPWSFTTGRSFSSGTTVTLTRKSDNKKWNFSSGSADGYFNVDNQGFGQGGCVCFRPSDIEEYKDGDVFSVRITDGDFTKEYQVSFFALHSYKTTLVKKATCTEYGLEKVTCTGCGESFEHRIPMAAHTMKDTVIAPTCTEYGYTEHKCTVCGYESYKTDYKEYLGHDYKDTVIKPTCTEMGYTLHKCSRCKTSYKDTYVSSLKHNYVKTKEVTYTCTEDGYTEMTCTRCKDSYKTNIVRTPGHSFGNWTTTKAATCTAQGVRTRTCSKCKNKETQSIAALGHSYTSRVIAPTCKDKGYTEKKCSRCGNIVKENYKDIDKSKHKFTKTKTVAATCKDKGYTEYKCSVCGEIKKDNYTNADAKLHKYTSKTVAPTCTEQGYTEHTCTVCGDSYKGGFKNPKGHHFDDGEMIKQPTYESKGEMLYKCTECGTTRTVAVPKLKNSSVNESSTDLKPADSISSKPQDGSSSSQQTDESIKPEDGSSAADISTSLLPADESSSSSKTEESSHTDDSRPDESQADVHPAAIPAGYSKISEDGRSITIAPEKGADGSISASYADMTTFSDISDSAAAGCTRLVISEGVTGLDLDAVMKKFPALTEIKFAKSVEDITTASEETPNIKVVCVENSFADVFAKANGMDTEYAENKPEYDRGDVTGDGTINVTDIAVLAAHIKGIKALDEEAQLRADVNGDNTLNVTDIAIIAAHIKGIRAIV